VRSLCKAENIATAELLAESSAVAGTQVLSELAVVEQPPGLHELVVTPAALGRTNALRVSRCVTPDMASGVVAGLVGNRFFACNGFAAVWRAKGGLPVGWAIEDRNGTAAVLPGVEFGVGFLCRFMSMPDGCYGGISFTPEARRNREQIAQLLLDAIVRRRYLKTYIFDFYGTVPADPRFSSVMCATTLVDISDKGWRPPDKKLLSQIRKAERQNITVETFDWKRHGVGFMNLVRTTSRRHGGAPRYSGEFFRALAELAERDERIHWLWCEYGGRPVCSHIYFIENLVLQGWQIYYDKAFSFLKANQYIRFMMCREMAKLGITRLNLGETPEGAAGLAYYKHRWGGEPFYYNCHVLKKGLGRFL